MCQKEGRPERRPESREETPKKASQHHCCTAQTASVQLCSVKNAGGDVRTSFCANSCTVTLSIGISTLNALSACTSGYLTSSLQIRAGIRYLYCQLPCSVQQAIERAEDAQHREIAMDCYSAQLREPEVVGYPLAKLLLLVRADLVDPASCWSEHLGLP